MGPESVVEPEVVFQPPLSLQDAGVGFQVHLLILHRPPQPLHEDVIGVPAGQLWESRAIWRDLVQVFPVDDAVWICFGKVPVDGGSLVEGQQGGGHGWGDI